MEVIIVADYTVEILTGRVCSNVFSLKTKIGE
jgi:hypothetical protein